MELENFIVSVLIFGLFVGVFALGLGDANDKYGLDINDSWADEYNKIDDIRTNVEGMESNLVGNDTISETDSYIDFFKGAYTAVLTIFDVIPLSFQILTTMSEQFGIPPIVFWTLTTIILIMIIFAVIRLLRRA